MVRNIGLAAMAAIAILIADMASAIAATLVARVDVSTQTMTVSQHGRVIHRWPVSTARRGFITPRGSWKPKRLHRMWHSRKYDMSPMPYSVFYHRGYAIHGTNQVRSLGRPASHGCVRLRTTNAKRFYDLVRRHGIGNTRVVVVN